MCYPGAIYSGSSFIQDSPGLDYALVQLAGNPAATYGYLEIDNRLAVVGEQVDLDKWTHVACVTEGTDVRLFVDGVPKSNIANKTRKTAFGLRVGANYSQGDERSLTTALEHGRALIESRRALQHREGSGRTTSACELYFNSWDNDYLDFIERTVDRRP